MAATAPLKKSLNMNEWMVQADPPKKANTVKKMNSRLLLLSPNKATVYFKYGRQKVVLWKEYIILKKPVVRKDTPASANICNCYSEKVLYLMNNCNFDGV